MSCVSSKSSRNTEVEHLENLRNVQHTFRSLKKKAKNKRYNEHDCREDADQAFKDLRVLAAPESSNQVLPFYVVSKGEFHSLIRVRDQHEKLEEDYKELSTALDKERKDRENNNIRHRREKDTLQAKYEEQETKAINCEEKVISLQGTIEREKNQKSEEIGRLELQNAKQLEEMENEMKKMQAIIDEKEQTEKMLGMEILRLQELEKQGKSQVEEKKKKLRKLEENIKDLENENRRFQEELKYMAEEKKTQENSLSQVLQTLQQREEYNEKLKRKFEAFQYDSAQQMEMQRNSIDKLNRHLLEEKKAKENALNRLSAAAANRLRDQNPGITDLSDPNRPLKLAEKVSELYDNEWTNAIENLEEMKVKEEKGIEILLKIIQNVFDICSEFGDVHLQSFPDLLVLPPAIYRPENDRVLSVEKVSSDLLKPMKDFRKSKAEDAITCLKEYFLNKEGKLKLKIKNKYLDPCKEYIEKCVELCWRMCVQDPPIYMDASYPTNSYFDSTKMRSFTKAGQFIKFVVWPTFFLHKDGPLLAKGVVQGSKTKITPEESCSTRFDSSDEEKFHDARTESGPTTDLNEEDAKLQNETQPLPKNNRPTAENGGTFNKLTPHEENVSKYPKSVELEDGGSEQNETVNGGSANDDVQSGGEGQKEKEENERQEEEEEEEDDDDDDDEAKSSSSQQANETPEQVAGNQGHDSDTKAAGDEETTLSYLHERKADHQVDNNTTNL